jgi:HSP20 family protein
MAHKGLTPWRQQHHREGGRGELTPFEDLRGRIDKMFDDMWSGFEPSLFRWPGEALGAFRPSCDIAENDKEIVFSFELPGMKEDDVEVTLSDDRLTVKGEKKVEKEEEDKGYHLVERSFGSFQRSFALPPAVDAAKTTADFENGVLSITVPKTAEAKEATRKVKIKAK